MRDKKRLKKQAAKINPANKGTVTKTESIYKKSRGRKHNSLLFSK